MSDETKWILETSEPEGLSPCGNPAFSWRPVPGDIEQANTFKEMIERAYSDDERDLIEQSRAVARSVYASQGIPAGEKYWLVNYETKSCKPKSNLTDLERHFAEAPWFYATEDKLWEVFDKPDAGRATSLEL